MQFFGVVHFVFVCLGEVNVHVETTALAVRDGVDEFGVGFALGLCGRIDEGLPVCCLFAVVMV